MLPTVIRTLALAAVLVTAAAPAQTLDDALAALARRVSARLVPGETLEFAHRNISTLPQAEAQRARAVFEKSLRRRGARSASVASLTLTVSENRARYLLVAELRRGTEYHVDTEPFQAAPPPPRPRVSLLKRLLWEQAEPVLDLVRADDRMYVLTQSQITALANADGRWQPVAAASVPAPPVRDPRGRLLLEDGQLTALLPGLTCRASAEQPLAPRCEDAAASFPLAGVDVRWTPGRNTLEANGWPAFFHAARIRDTFLVTAADGRALLFDEKRSAAGTLAPWNASDLAAVDAPCAPQHLLALRDASTLQVYDLAGRQMIEAGEPEPLAGSLTALWPAAGGALAVVRDAATSQYAAYHVTVACRP